MNKYISLAAVAAAALALGVSGAHAATLTGNLAVSMQLNGTCTATSGTLNFGTIAGDPSGTAGARHHLRHML